MSRKVLVRLTLVLMLAVLFFQARNMAAKLEPQDFGEFWASAKLVTDNPYSFAKVLPLQRSIGMKHPWALVMRNPPWVLPFILPLRPFSYVTAFALATMLSVAVLAVSTFLVWRLYGGPAWVAVLLPLTFVPTLVLLILGQFIAALPFLGICLFLWNIEQGWDWAAGAWLLLPLLKPHLFLPFAACLVCWIVFNRRYRVVGGTVLALSLASLIAGWVNPHVFSQYKEVAANYSIDKDWPPTLSLNIQRATGSVALAVVPTLAGVCFVLWRWWKRRFAWSWKAELPVLLLTSLLCSYHMLLYDEVLLLAALVPVAGRGGSRFWISFAAINVLCLFSFVKAWHPWMPLAVAMLLSFWSACGWCLVYSIAHRQPTRAAAASQ